VFCYQGQIITHNTNKKYAPDTAALQYLLNNRAPDRWKNRQEEDEDMLKGAEINIKIGYDEEK